MKIQQLINISRVWVCGCVCVLSVDSSRPVAASVADTSLEMIMESLHPPRNHRLLPNSTLSPHPPCDYPKMLTEALVVNLSTYKQIFFLNMRKLWMWQWGKWAVPSALSKVKIEFVKFFFSFSFRFFFILRWGVFWICLSPRIVVVSSLLECVCWVCGRI